jgi:hypothetical protein
MLLFVSAPTKLSLIACARTIRTAATIGTLIVPVVPLTLSAPNVIVSDVNGILTQVNTIIILTLCDTCQIFF